MRGGCVRARCGAGKAAFFSVAQNAESAFRRFLLGVFHLARAGEMHIAAFAHGKLRLPGRVLCFPQGLWRGNCPNAIGRSCQTLGCSRAALCGASLHVPDVVKKSEVSRLLSELKKSERCVCFLYFTRAKKLAGCWKQRGSAPSISVRLRAAQPRQALWKAVNSRYSERTYSSKSRSCSSVSFEVFPCLSSWLNLRNISKMVRARPS